MTHGQVLEKFKELISVWNGQDYMCENIELYFPNGKNSIRIRLINRTELVFTYDGPKNWSIMTKDEFVNTVHGRNKK